MAAVTVDTLPPGDFGESITDGVKITRGPDGVVVEEGAGEIGPRIPSKGEFDENLAEYMSENERRTLATRLIEYMEVDKESRKDWEALERRGLQLSGIEKDPDKNADDAHYVLSPGAARVKMPVLMEAATHFQARFIAEMFPSTGPVKAEIIGEQTPDKVAQRDRIETFGNYYLTKVDTGYFTDTDQMGMYLPFSGSAFRKGSQNWVTGMPELRYIKATNFIAPYSATSLEDAPRYAHTYSMNGQDVRRAMESGMFTTMNLIKPKNIETVRSATSDASDNRHFSEHDDDANYPIAEYHIDMELDADRMGRRRRRSMDEIASQDLLPYIVIVEIANNEILMVRRNWKQKDKNRRKRIWFTHHKFFPGLGFYGWGYPHVIGSLQKAINDSINGSLDAAFASNFQGGFATKEARAAGIGGEIDLEHGKWKHVEGSFEDLNKALYTPPFKEPSVALVNLTEKLMEVAQRFSSVTEAATGDADNTGPVGTTLALIEQSNVVPTSIHKRLHQSMGIELKMWADLVYDFMPNDYNYEIGQEQKQLLKSDFDGRVDVVPVSDPNIWSQKQRIALAQGVLELQTSDPSLYGRQKRVAAHRRMMEAMRTPDIDAVAPDEEQGPTYQDAVAENMAMMMGGSVKAFETQDHQAHMIVHAHGRATVLGSPSFVAMEPERQQQTIAAFDAHDAEHMALGYRRLILASAQIQLPPVESQEQLPPDIEQQITAAVVARLPPPPPPVAGAGSDPTAAAIEAKTKADVEAKSVQAKAQVERETEAFIAEETRKQEAFAAEQRRLDEANRAEIAMKAKQLDAEEQRKDTSAATELVRTGAKASLERDHMKKSAEIKTDSALDSGAVKLATTQAQGEQKLAHGDKVVDQKLAHAEKTTDQKIKAADAVTKQKVKGAEKVTDQKVAAGEKTAEQKRAVAEADAQQGRRHKASDHRQDLQHGKEDHELTQAHAQEDHEKLIERGDKEHKVAMKQTEQSGKLKIQQTKQQLAAKKDAAKKKTAAKK